MKAINSIAWAVPPGAKGGTRPAQLVKQLAAIGVLDDSPEFFFHGRSKSTSHQTSAGVLRPFSALPAEGGGLAVLSPVFGAQSVRSARWIDFYDDWSTAPDINPWHRILSMGAYAEARATKGRPVTTNSIYMALKTGTPLSHVVPNGVDPGVSMIPRRGNNERRLIVLGHFFKGRTDFDLLRSILMSDLFDEVVIGGPGTDRVMLSIISSVSRQRPGLLRIEPWLDEDGIAKLTGSRTVALVPHVVSDYTLSQDMMKIYTFAALGIPVICPRLLWPAHLAPEFALLYDFGMSIVSAVPEWIESPAPSDDWRRDFGQANSWKRRAMSVAKILEF